MTPTRVKENRELIARELDKTLIVEAAAGTGKTTELVRRIVALVANARARIEQIVAVTFSEKAAGELKLRLREELERAREKAAPGSAESRLLDAAVHDFEEAQVSTIHGFCAELLRERPVEACVDPAFTVLTESQAERFFQEAFASWLHTQLANPQEGVRRSLRRPVKWRFGDETDDGPIDRLRAAAANLREWRDHPAPWKRPAYDRPASIRTVSASLKAFADLIAKPIKRDDRLAQSLAEAGTTSLDIERQRRMVGDMVPDGVWDGWEAALAALANDRDFANPKKGTGAAFAIGVTRQQVLDRHAQLVDELRAFRANVDADLAALLHEEMRDCLDLYERRKQKAGALDFLDLLIKARDLVHDNAEIRREFRARYRAILVDEFQDTDPLQADLLRDLAGDESGQLRPGALFIVGDPKQSIYRFRRADVGAYRRIADGLGDGGAVPVTLQTSYRSVPAIQHFVNAAFAGVMDGNPESLQADYVPLLAHRRDTSEQPAVVALPVPRPYGKYAYGPPQVTQTALNQSQPPAIAAFVAWLLSPECTWTVADGESRRKIVASDVCLLFRRFMNFGRDITRDYVEGLEARGIPHLLVGGKTFHEREEVDAVRTALTAIEWPEDELSVYAALHGPLFAIGEEELLEYHSIARVFHPYRIPADLPDRLKPIAEALRTLRDLHAARNHRPVADTIGRLIAVTRAHAGFVLWRGGEQALANVLHISDLARRYELEGGLSFRGFVDTLHDASGRTDSPEAPILEEGSNGVRLMTVHKAKGLEFPIVVLADIACKLSLEEASRYLEPERKLCAIRIGGWSPLDLQEHNAEEAKRDEAEGIPPGLCRGDPRPRRAGRARGRRWSVRQGLDPAAESRALSATCAVAGARHCARRAVVQGQADDRLRRARRRATRRRHDSARHLPAYDPDSGQAYSVVWWDPLLLEGAPDDARGVRREDLISAKDVRPEDIAADRARYDEWRERRRLAQEMGSVASTRIATATEIIKDATEPRPVPDIVVEDAGQFLDGRPSGRRFGTLVHAVLASLPLDAGADEAESMSALHAKLFAATDEERRVAATMAAAVTKHARWQAARASAAAGKRVWREVPVSLRLDGQAGSTPTIVDGQVDLAYETDAGWVVIDFKTDIEIASAQDAYKQQVALYAEAVSKATGRPATGVLLRV